MAESKSNNFEVPLKAMEENTTRMVEDFGRLVTAWTAVGTEMALGTTRIATNLVAGMSGEPLAKAARDMADVVQNSADRFSESFGDGSDSSAESGDSSS